MTLAGGGGGRFVLAAGGTTMTGGPPLSPETQRRLELVFHGDDARVAAEMLERECGNNIPFCEQSDSVQMERIRFAALKVSEGKLQTLREAVELAKIDWRDLLMWAGFGNNVNAHKKWLAEQHPRG